jgi:hypothetical protein
VRRREIEGELKSFPELEDNAQAILISMCTRYSKAINDYLQGHANQFTYYSKLRPYLSVFKKKIEETKPKIGHVQGRGSSKG